MSGKTELVLVPREPTPEMHTAHAMYGDTSDWWNAVLAAAPQPPAEAQAQGGGEVDATFAEWLATEMPAGTIIGDPAWWADRIARQYAKRCAPTSAPDRDAYEGAREDLLDWKRRAQRAEATLRGLGYKGIDASEAPSAPVGMEALKARAWELLQAEYDRDHFAGNYEDAAIDAIIVALAQQPAPSAPVGVEGIANEIDNYHWEVADWGKAAEFAERLRALAQHPAAVDEAMVEEANDRTAIAAYEKFMGVSADDPAYGPDLSQWMAGWNAALAAHPGGSDNGR